MGKQKIVVLGLLKIFQGVTANDINLILPLLSQLLGWWLYVIKETEIDNLEFAEDMHPDTGSDDDDKSEWTEADRISSLYCNDMVSHTFMIHIVLKTLKDCCQKLNISMQNLLKQIASKQQQNNNDNNHHQNGNGKKKQDIISDCMYCTDKYNQYL